MAHMKPTLLHYVTAANRAQKTAWQETFCRVYPKLPKAAHSLPRNPVTVQGMHGYLNFSQQLSMLTEMPSVLKSQTCAVVLG